MKKSNYLTPQISEVCLNFGNVLCGSKSFAFEAEDDSCVMEWEEETEDITLR